MILDLDKGKNIGYFNSIPTDELRYLWSSLLKDTLQARETAQYDPPLF